MLGSVHDADDALQDTLIRAWRGAAGLREGSSTRSWLYAIATNVCLTEIDRRRRRVLPRDLGPAVDGSEAPGRPLTEDAWLEPYPDVLGGASHASPAARYEQSEGVELAFVAAVQHLAANQRAALMLCDVLGFSARESADMLETTVASVNSALQRARSAVSERIPARSQQATLRALGEPGLRELVSKYVDAWERCDVAAFAALLAEDVTFAMPPLRTWYASRDEVVSWARNYSINGAWRWKAVECRANGQLALAFYAWDEASAAHLPFALNVLTLRPDGLVGDVTAFIVRATDAVEDDAYVRFPDRPMHRRLADLYPRFDLPAQI
jgi:RNA polymerase sigma-70 factor (ECF subfamily)